MLRTAIEIPCGALINAVTDQESERSKMISAYTIVMGIFTTISTSFALSLVSLFGGGNTSKGYMIVVGIAGIIMILSCWWCFIQTKETCVAEKDKKPIFEEIRQLLKIKGLFPVIVIWLASYVAYNMMMASSVYYMMYYAARPDLIGVYMLDISVVGLIAFVFGKNLPVLFVFSGLASLFATLSMPYVSMIMTEMIDYTYLKSGNLMNGTMAALKGFTNKCGIAISSGVIGGVLGATGYVAGAIGQQPQATMIGINMIRFGVPMVMAVVVIVCLKCYPITDELKQKFGDFAD